MTDIISYGFPKELLPPEDSLARPARVSAVHKERFQLVTPDGEQYARLKTKEYYYQEDQPFPTAGDYVLALPAAGDWQIIRTLPRKSFFSRMDSFRGTEQAVAANMDLVFVTQSLNENFNVKRLERYLTLAWNSKAEPIVLLTKCDLPGDHQAMCQAAEQTAGKARVMAVSAQTGQGFHQLEACLAPGKTAAFLGSSGVGKSTVINRLAGQVVMDTGAVRQEDSRGRHTTTHRQLILLPGGSLVIDTPGMRELGMWDAAQGLAETFPDVEAFLGQCRFNDCRHQGEPGCAVAEAIATGALSQERWESYQQLAVEAGRKGRKHKSKRGKPGRKQG